MCCVTRRAGGRTRLHDMSAPTAEPAFITNARDSADVRSEANRPRCGRNTFLSKKGERVLRGRGKGHPERFRQFAEVVLAIGEMPEHGPPRRVGESVEDAIERG